MLDVDPRKPGLPSESSGNDKIIDQLFKVVVA